MTKIIVLTDIHMAVSPRAGRPNPLARLTAALAHIATHNGDADRVIVTGDLTHEGDAASYEQLREALNGFTLPVHLMIGNHDNRETFQSVFPQVPRDPNGFVQQVVDLPERRLILLDTLFAPPYDYPASHAGVLCDRRMEWLEDRLSERADTPCLLFMHHHPHEIGFPSMDSIRLTNGETFYARITDHANVQHIICGHIHRTISGSHRGIPFSIFKSTVGQMPMDFTSLDTHVENNDPAAYGILLLSEGGVIAHTEDYELGT